MPQDSYMLSMLANSLDMFQTALEDIKTHGSTQKSDKTGWTQTNGYFAVLKASEERIIQLSRKFGLSLQDRAKLQKEMPAMRKKLPDISGNGIYDKPKKEPKKPDPMNPLTWGIDEEEEQDPFSRI